MKTLQDLVFNIIEKHLFEYDSKNNRSNIISELNFKIFNDKVFENVKFIDVSHPKKNFFVSVMIDYNGDLYNILAFEKIYKILIRKEKLKKLRNL